MKKEIDWWLEKFTQMTKEESDFIYDILKLDNEKKSAFMIAKRIFEEVDEFEKDNS